MTLCRAIFCKKIFPTINHLRQSKLDFSTKCECEIKLKAKVLFVYEQVRFHLFHSLVLRGGKGINNSAYGKNIKLFPISKQTGFLATFMNHIFTYIFQQYVLQLHYLILEQNTLFYFAYPQNSYFSTEKNACFTQGRRYDHLFTCCICSHC